MLPANWFFSRGQPGVLLNIFMHFSHWKSFVFECTDTSCFLAYSLDWNFFLQTLHSSVRAECTDLLWVRRCVDWENVLLQVLHLYGFPLCELFHAIPANSCGETFYHNDCMWMRIPVCESLRGFVTNCCCAFGTHKIGKQMAFLCASPGDPEVCWLIQIVLGIFCI